MTIFSPLHTFFVGEIFEEESEKEERVARCPTLKMGGRRNSSPFGSGRTLFKRLKYLKHLKLSPKSFLFRIIIKSS